MTRSKTNFEGKFISKLSKIDKQELEGFLSQLVREKNFLEIIFNALVDGIVVLQPSLQVLYANDAALELLNISSRRRIIGERLTQICPNRQVIELVSRFALERKPVENVEIESSSRPARLLATSIITLEDDGSPTDGGAVIILRDITEARKLEEERRRTERVTAFTTLAAGLAHEIKNPLNSLQIHAQLLQKALTQRDLKKMDATRAARSSEIIVEEIQRLGRVVNDFLTAVRPTKPMFQRGNINTLVERIGATVEPEAESRGTRLVLVLDHDIPPTDFDSHQLTQAVLNLVKNALDAVEAKDEPRIEIRTLLEGAHYAIRVSDNGNGMSDDELKKIFEPYFTTKFGGTGLGLAIVSRIVDEHGGSVNIDSRPEQGTAVTLTFPLDSRPVRLLDDSQPFFPPLVSSSHP